MQRDGATRHDTYSTQARALDIDHLVPLAESWTPAPPPGPPPNARPTPTTSKTPRALIAVSATSNRSKSNQDPATWQPPAAGYRCTYATHWISIKTRWSLTIDHAEQNALTEALTSCPNSPIEVTRAR
ncbi:DUF1524 domain-containing protein [Streptomyces sp. NPDC005474]|uniref:GmrSD restriction endonuclease domain-containing protein n=1 Tax=Streptomyces sp. NPDC005474 TaxID=3154878 RepID=UPI003451B90C